jgi:sec-independent protein translocase protein TatA
MADPTFFLAIPFFPSIGTTELLIILVIIVIFFGVGRLPEIGKALGEGIKSFRSAQSGKGADEKDEKQGSEKPDAGAATSEKDSEKSRNP